MKKVKRIVVLIMTAVFAIGLCACGGETEETMTIMKKRKQYIKSGIRGKVEGQWKFTVDKVTVTDERNEFEESNPAEVIVVDYHYENIGYEDESGIMDGLFLDPGMAQVIDAQGNMCSEYPLVSIDAMPQETPVGAKCTAQTAIGLKADGSPVKVLFEQYDGNDEIHEATFELEF